MKHTIRNVLLVILGFVALFGIGLHHHEVTTLYDVQSQNKNYKADITNLTNQYNSINPNNIHKQYDKTQPNLNNIEIKNKRILNKGIVIAYNQSQTPKKYRKNKGTVQKLLGNDIYSRIQAITRPKQNETLPTYQSESSKLKGCQISYGQYNSQNKQLPINIMITYLTPIINAHANSVNPKPDYKRYVGHTVMDVTLNIQNGNMTVNDAYNQINGFSM